MENGETAGGVKNVEGVMTVVVVDKDEEREADEKEDIKQT